MTAGAVSRTVAQLCMHPVNTFKTILQMKGPSNFINIFMNVQVYDVIEIFI